MFGHFLRICTSDLSKTRSETWESCEQFNDNVVSRKILVIIIIIIIGLSASAAEAYGFTSVRACVRASVRHISYLENRASDFDDFLHKATS